MSVAGTSRNAARNLGNAVGRQARQEAQQSWKHIQLRGLPRSTTPSDIRRVLQTNNIGTVDLIRLDLHRFLPTGRAYLDLHAEGLTEGTIRSLRGTTISSQRINAVPCPPPEIPTRPKVRGVKGFNAAADRGAIRGNGPGGDVSGGGKNVVLYGLPGQITHEEMREHLRGFELAPEDRGQRVVVKLDTDGSQGYASTSRHFVKMNSPSEAYRLVRQWHMMPFLPQQYGEKFVVKAEIIH